MTVKPWTGPAAEVTVSRPMKMLLAYGQSVIILRPRLSFKVAWPSGMKRPWRGLDLEISQIRLIYFVSIFFFFFFFFFNFDEFKPKQFPCT